MMLKEKCQMTDSEWEERQKTRQLEREAVSKALAVLSGDDAHDLFTRTFNPALLQEESSMHSARRLLAAKLLSEISDRAILGWHQSDIQRPKSYSWGSCDEPERAFGLPLMDVSSCSHSIAALAPARQRNLADLAARDLVAVDRRLPWNPSHAPISTHCR